MTSEELCECSADELDKLTFLQLEEYFKPFWPTTRPERKQSSNETTSNSVASKSTTQPRRQTNRTAKSSDARMVALENKLSPERLKFLRENGLI